MTIRDTTFERRRELFRDAAAIIHHEYAHDLDLDAVARRIATSRRQLQRAFAEIGGTSFRDYLAEVRMRRAVELLRDSEAHVRDVATSVGYRQPAQFAKAFRRRHGDTPSRFRRQNGNGAASDNGAAGDNGALNGSAPERGIAQQPGDGSRNGAASLAGRQPIPA
jgi:AraC family transcriptional regulator of adaptative response / methylphosphotriester-DNA alkyltransferase methyltransferase